MQLLIHNKIRAATESIRLTKLSLSFQLITRQLNRRVGLVEMAMGAPPAGQWKMVEGQGLVVGEFRNGELQWRWWMAAD